LRSWSCYTDTQGSLIRGVLSLFEAPRYTPNSTLCGRSVLSVILSWGIDRILQAFALTDKGLGGILSCTVEKSCEFWQANMERCGCRTPEDKDYALSQQMVSYLCNFASTGNPNKTSALPTWIASGKEQKRVLVLGEKDTHMGKPNMLKMIHTMLTNKAVGE